MISSAALSVFPSPRGAERDPLAGAAELTRLATRASQIAKTPQAAQAAVVVDPRLAKLAERASAAGSAADQRSTSAADASRQSLALREEAVSSREASLAHFQKTADLSRETLRIYEKTGKVVWDGEEVSYDLTPYGGQEGFVSKIREQLERIESFGISGAVEALDAARRDLAETRQGSVGGQAGVDLKV